MEEYQSHDVRMVVEKYSIMISNNYYKVASQFFNIIQHPSKPRINNAHSQKLKKTDDNMKEPEIRMKQINVRMRRKCGHGETKPKPQSKKVHAQ